MSLWYEKPIAGVLLDISGVLYDAGNDDGCAIPGSVEAVQRLKASGLPVRFCTNETTTTRKKFVDKLRRLGFNMSEEEVFPPIPAVCSILKQRGLRPHLLVDPEALSDFDDVEKHDPNCVVLGDAGDTCTYENMNKAFRCLMEMEKPVLFSLGKGKYYQQNNKLTLDVGPFMKALEYACDLEAEIVGKPSQSFFNIALQDMGITADQCVMVGDDIMGDVGGAQNAGMRGVQVRTGKYRPADENHPSVKADGRVEDLAEAVNIILKNR